MRVSRSVSSVYIFIASLNSNSGLTEGGYLMDRGNARQFLVQLCSDAAFREQYWASVRGRPLDILDFAHANGFLFTMTELREALWYFSEHFVINQMCETLHIPGKRPFAQMG
jgi:hypothetical protein